MATTGTRLRRALVGALGLAALAGGAASARADVVPTDPDWHGSSWAYVRTGTTAAWEVTLGSSSLTVAVVDTGVEPVADLAGALLPGIDLVHGDSVAEDDVGLGTQVAGAVAARGGDGVGTAGLCWRCRILPVKVSAVGVPATTARVAAGIDWAVAHGADVVVTSLAATLPLAALQTAVADARAADVVVVAAAGNDGTPAPRYPAAYPGVLSVGATDARDARTGFTDYGAWVRIAAPGCVHLPNRLGVTRLSCATAFAAGLVAGAAALVRAEDPAATEAQVRAALESSADPIARGVTASGRLDVVGALVARGATAPPPGPPVNSSPPRIAGDVRLDGVAVAAPGDWLPRPGGATVGLAYRWLRCDASGGACAAIPGATANAYRLTLADTGSRLRLEVTGTQTGASSVALSALTAVVATPAPPTVALLPSIAGTARVGSFVTASAGRWRDMRAVTFQWRRCDAAGAACAALPGATSTFYAPTALDVGSTIAVRVTVTGPGGTAVADTPATAVVVAYPPPANRVAPRIEGATTVGVRLVASSGVWSDQRALSLQWRRCSGGACADLAGETDAAHLVTPADTGSTLVVRVTGSNLGGTTTVDSAPTAVVTAAPGPAASALPVVRGATAAGGELWLASPGTWSGSPTGYTIAWLRCDATGGACAPIAGAASSVHLVVAADVGSTLRARVTVLGAGGSATADSAASAVVAAS